MIVAPEVVSMSKSINLSSRAVCGVIFLGLPFRVDLCAGISRRGGIVGLRIDFGAGCGITAKDLDVSVNSSNSYSVSFSSYLSSVSRSVLQCIQSTRSYALAS